MGSLLIGFGLALLFGFRVKVKNNKKEKIFVCGHCEVEDTLQLQKIRENNIFTCSNCERILDEYLIKIMYLSDYNAIINDSEEYEELKKKRKEKSRIENASK